MIFRLSLLALLVASLALSQSAPVENGAPPAEEANAENITAPAEEEVADESEDRTRLNLLGEVDASGGEGRRNENVRLTLIDNNVLKEMNVRMGTSATVIKEFSVEQSYFGKEFGGSASPSLHQPSQNISGIHGQAFWTHNNSAFSARSFFQVGDVQPARTNDYGLTAGIPLWKGATLSFNGSRRKLRGQVNGNVLVPAADERTPLTTDPKKRAIVEAILGAYPAETPNRTDINPRALNTNAPQNIDNDRIGSILDQALGDKDRLSLRYNFTLQKVEAFQLVGGQNPDTTTRNHQARLTWNRAWSAVTTTDFSIGFDRVGSLLVPDETSLGPFYLFGRELQSIGPSGSIPIDRSQNMFRYSGRVLHLRGNHMLTLGFDLTRRQINGSEDIDHRGKFSFREDFGNDTVTNLRLGMPSSYTKAIGNVHRGFRNLLTGFYVGDDWRATPQLTLSLGMRYEPVTRPSEVNELSEVPYPSDWNNLAPRFGFAYRLPGTWGVIRAAYGLHYGEIFPATFMQSRFNPPGNLVVQVDVPDLVDPFAGRSDSDLIGDGRSTLYQLASDVSTPYSHLYNFSWELTLLTGWTLELGYLGSRSHRLLTMFYKNRARVVPGIEQISETINERRPDQRYFDVLHIHNGSRGYFDAAKITLRAPRWKGFTIDGSYWFSKAIDLGADYTGTASGRDGRVARSPSEFGFQAEMRGLSRFDQPHAMRWTVNYETPSLTGQGRLFRGVLGAWEIGSVLLLKSGTPFTVQSGSDSPDYGNVDGASSDNPILLDPSVLGRSIDHPDTSVERLPRSAFATIRPTDPRGNLGRNTFRKDGIVNVNLALSKRWVMTGEKSLLLRAESLNFFNHPQFEEPGFSLSGENFAVITNTLNDGRTFRFTLQLSF